MEQNEKRDLKQTGELISMIYDNRNDTNDKIISNHYHHFIIVPHRTISSHFVTKDFLLNV